MHEASKDTLTKNVYGLSEALEFLDGALPLETQIERQNCGMKFLTGKISCIIYIIGNILCNNIIELQVYGLGRTVAFLAVSMLF